MDELARYVRGLCDRVVPAWNPARNERAFQQLQRVRLARELRLRGAIAGAGIVAVAFCVSLAERPAPATHEATRAGMPLSFAARGPGRTVLAEGSAIELTSPEADIFVESNQPARVAVRLKAGAAHFEVVPNIKQRQFSVFAGAVEVAVVGTMFDVALSDTRVHVAVAHGKVRVHSPAGVTFLEAGEARDFDDVVTTALPAADDGAAISRANPSQPRRRESSAPRSRAKPRGAANDVDALLDAADAARQSGQLETAALYLRKVVAAHRESAATPLAAFTLGRLLLERLGRPAEAAAAFATARELAPAGSLASDALAREVEAWSKSGNADLAAERAEAFLKAYPNNRRARVMELYLGPQPGAATAPHVPSLHAPVSRADDR